MSTTFLSAGNNYWSTTAAYIHPISHNPTEREAKRKYSNPVFLTVVSILTNIHFCPLKMTPRLHILLWIYLESKFYGIESKELLGVCFPIFELPMSRIPPHPAQTSLTRPWPATSLVLPHRPSSYHLSSLLPQKGKSAMLVSLHRMRWPPAGTSHWPLWLERDLPRQSFSCRE